MAIESGWPPNESGQHRAVAREITSNVPLGFVKLALVSTEISAYER